MRHVAASGVVFLDGWPVEEGRIIISMRKLSLPVPAQRKAVRNSYAAAMPAIIEHSSFSI